jgi:uncharacterized protein
MFASGNPIERFRLRHLERTALRILKGGLMSMQMLRSRIGKTLLSFVSILAPTITVNAQAEEDGAQNAPATTLQSKGVGVVLMEDRVSELITTHGQATISSPPDAMRAELGVEVRARLLKQAHDELSLKIEKLTQAIKALKRENLNLQTSQLSLSPLFDEPRDGKAARIVGYRARGTLSITLQDVDPAKLGTETAVIVDTGVKAGANIVEGVSFFLSHPDRIRARALEMAMIDSESQAKILAASAGMRLGSVHDVNGPSDRSGPTIYRDDFALSALAKIEPGNVTTTVEVHVRYHFIRP